MITTCRKLVTPDYRRVTQLAFTHPIVRCGDTWQVERTLASVGHSHNGRDVCVPYVKLQAASMYGVVS